MTLSFVIFPFYLYLTLKRCHRIRISETNNECSSNRMYRKRVQLLTDAFFKKRIKKIEMQNVGGH